MRKIIILFFLIFAFANKVIADPIKNIIVKGNERVSKETIIIYGDIKIGADYEASDINLLIKKRILQFFSDVCSVTAVVLTISTPAFTASSSTKSKCSNVSGTITLLPGDIPANNPDFSFVAKRYR